MIFFLIIVEQNSCKLLYFICENRLYWNWILETENMSKWQNLWCMKAILCQTDSISLKHFFCRPITFLLGLSTLSANRKLYDENYGFFFQIHRFCGTLKPLADTIVKKKNWQQFIWKKKKLLTNLITLLNFFNKIAKELEKGNGEKS